MLKALCAQDVKNKTALEVKYYVDFGLIQFNMKARDLYQKQPTVKSNLWTTLVK